MKYSIIWLTGGSDAGKTTVAKELQKRMTCIILDGDEMRESISLGAGFSKEERTEHNFRVARLANILSKQINVLVSVIAPIKEVRDEISKICNPLWIYVKRTLPPRKNHFYEESRGYFTVNHDELSIQDSADTIEKKIIELISKRELLWLKKY